MKKKDKMTHKELPFNEYTAFDNDKCLLKITGFDPNNVQYYIINVLVKNNSTDKTYSFLVNRGSVNGLDCHLSFEKTVYAGKKAIGEIRISRSELDKLEIFEYTDIEFTFEAYDNDDPNMDIIMEETLHVYPYGKDKAVKYMPQLKATDKVLNDNKDVTIIVIGQGKKDNGNYFVDLFLYNKTNTVVELNTEGGSVNDFMVNAYIQFKPVKPGHSAIVTVSWYKKHLDACGIKDVEEVQFSLSACGVDSRRGDFVKEQIILVNGKPTVRPVKVKKVRSK